MISLTALVLTKNEEANIERTLRAIRWIDNVVIIDSFSSDRTLKLARSAHPSVTIVQREFDSFAGQCNFGLSQVSTEWVLSLDADYVLSDALSREIKELTPATDVSGYAAEFTYCVHGHALRATVYPPRTVLYRRGLAQYYDEGHGHRVRVDGSVCKLQNTIYHDDRKPFDRWLTEQKKYVAVEAKYLRKRMFGELSGPDKLRRSIFLAAPVMFFYTLLFRGLILDGLPGWTYVGQRTLAELLLSKELLFGRARQ